MNRQYRGRVVPRPALPRRVPDQPGTVLDEREPVHAERQRVGRPLERRTLAGEHAVAGPGDPLDCAHGDWAGAQPITFTYRWLRNGTPIAGATDTRYVVTTADDGQTLTC